MVIRHSILELLAKSMVKRPMKCIVVRPILYLLLSAAFYLHSYRVYKHSYRVLSAHLPRITCTVIAFYLQLSRFTCTVTAFYLHSYRVLLAQLPRFTCTVTAFYLHSHRVLLAQLPRFTCTVTAFYLHSYRVLNDSMLIVRDDAFCKKKKR